MRYRYLGNTGLAVSELCLGTMSFGGSTDLWKAIGALDQKAATEMVARALDAGVNFFDTAEGYAGGEAETLLGRALGGQINDVVVATKVGFPAGPGPNERGLSRGRIFAAVDGSLKRLGRDWIDLYFLHKRDPRTPLEESLRALDDLVRAGKVRYLGASNYPAWQVADAAARAECGGAARLEALQVYYNLAARDVEREIVPLCRERRIGLMAWSPLAQGVLTGKYGAAGEAPRGARRATFELGPMDWARVGRIVGAARAIAAARGASLAQVGLAWLLANETVTTLILGARRIEQLDDNLGAASLDLTDEEVTRLDEASAIPPEYPGWYVSQFDGV